MLCATASSYRLRGKPRLARLASCSLEARARVFSRDALRLDEMVRAVCSVISFCLRPLCASLLFVVGMAEGGAPSLRGIRGRGWGACWRRVRGAVPVGWSWAWGGSGEGRRARRVCMSA
eukprot:1676196-Prymnesium_polylepis.1